MISFGPRSILLAIGTLHGFALAALLLRVPANRTANRLLAMLVALVALRILPYIIGFAGFYDAYPWLTYLPYEWSLGYGAVIWLYVTVVCTGHLPRRWRWHLVPAALQGAYYAMLFVQSLAFKNHWNSTVHVPFVTPVESAWTLTALAAYLALSWRRHVEYQRWLDSSQSNREEFRLTWLRVVLVAIGVTLALWAGTVLYDAFVEQLDYFDRFGLYLWFSLLVYGLGAGGLRNARLVYLRPAAVDGSDLSIDGAAASAAVADDVMTGDGPDVAPIKDASPTSSDRQHDWELMGRRWKAVVSEQGWWRDPGLTAPVLARLLATNTTYLSRALNTGLGQNFNEFINELRVRAVQAELGNIDQQRDVLTIALDAGFNSKASFNRVFKRITGETPSEFRRRQGSTTSQLP